MPGEHSGSNVSHAERVSRQRAAERLVDIAYGLTAGEALALRADGIEVKVPVPDELLLELESRSDGLQAEVRVVLSWTT